MIDLALAQLDLIDRENWRKLVKLHEGDEVKALASALGAGLGSAVEAKKGMRWLQWWTGLDADGRRHWLGRAGDNARPADIYNAYRLAQAHENLQR